MKATSVFDECGEPVEERDFAVWTRWFEQADRSIARTVVTPDVTVLTTFSGSITLRQGEPPRLFETRVFGGVLDSRNRGTARESRLNS